MSTAKDKINALFVETNGVYFSLKNIEPWDINRDATKCRNGAPAICHPPCERWGRYWGGGPSVRKKRLLGDDNQYFAFSLWYVRTFGGVIEHPEGSHAWRYYNMRTPHRAGGWIEVDDYSGWGCCVAQGHYGHPAQKLTWLYANKANLKPLKWGLCKNKMRLDEEFHSKEERARAIRTGICQRLSKRQRAETPAKFRDTLIGLLR